MSHDQTNRQHTDNKQSVCYFQVILVRKKGEQTATTDSRSINSSVGVNSSTSTENKYLTDRVVVLVALQEQEIVL